MIQPLKRHENYGTFLGYLYVFKIIRTSSGNGSGFCSLQKIKAKYYNIRYNTGVHSMQVLAKYNQPYNNAFISCNVS